MMTPDSFERRRNKNRVILLTLIAVAVLPMLVAVVLKLTNWHPRHTVNYGQLIHPAQPLRDVSLELRSGDRIHLSDLRHKWLMLTFSRGACLGACAKNIYKMRQVHVAQGRHAPRVRRMLVVLPGTDHGEMAQMVRAYPDMKVVIGPHSGEADLARQLKTPGGDALNEPGWIYFIDPLGNYMMRYPPDADPSGIRRDLARLLRVSQIG
jgi:cytochrome oxidase Cu insertion factor (SCO1/SenC/PrrC family)